MKKTYKRHAHSVSLLHAHLVFVVKYRRSVITRQVFDILKRVMRAQAKKLGATIEAIESDGDHLHVLLIYPPKLALSKLSQHLKGASSRVVRLKKLPEVTKKLWGSHFWSPSYFVVSCGGAPLDVVRTYVETQQLKSLQPEKEKAPSAPARRARKKTEAVSAENRIPRHPLSPH